MLRAAGLRQRRLEGGHLRALRQPVRFEHFANAAQFLAADVLATVRQERGHARLPMAIGSSSGTAHMSSVRSIAVSHWSLVSEA